MIQLRNLTSDMMALHIKKCIYYDIQCNINNARKKKFIFI